MVSSTLYTNFLKTGLKDPKVALLIMAQAISLKKPTKIFQINQKNKGLLVRIGIVLSKKANTDKMDNKFMNFYSSLCL